MKVLHLVPYYPPERIGGVGEFVAGLHTALLAHGHDSVVVTTGTDSQPDVHRRTQVVRIAKTPLGWFLKVGGWAAKAAQCDIVHCQAGEALPLLVLLRLHRRKAQVLTTFHVSFKGIGAAWHPYRLENHTFGRGLRPWLYRMFMCRLHRLCDRISLWLSDTVNTISIASAQEILGDGKTAARIIYYGLAPLAAAERTIAVDSIADTELLYVGVGGHRKRVTALPFLLHHVHAVMPQARLRIIGFSPESEPEMHSLFAQHGLLASVEYTGPKRSVDLPPYYASAQVLVVPSAYEGLPLVILEAMRSGLPVVATRVSGHPEVIEDGTNGFLVDLDCPKQMADRCIQLLTDPALKARMSQAARQTVQHRFCLDRQVQEYLAVYRELCGLQQAAKEA